MRFLRRFPIHALLMTIYPSIELLSSNIEHLFPYQVTNALFISIYCGVILIIGFQLIIRDWQRAGLLTSIVATWFFTYGHIYILLKGDSVAGLLLGRHRYIFPVWTSMIILVSIWIFKNKRSISNFTAALNISLFVIVLIPLYRIGAFQYRQSNISDLYDSHSSNPNISWEEDSLPPDIYYIVLDAYTRSDILEQEFEIDTTQFIDSLEQLGFVIASCAQSNYTRTLESLTSTFNMEYVHPKIGPMDAGYDRSHLIPPLKQNLVRGQLEKLGYKTVVFKNPWERYLWDDADIVFRSSGAGYLSPFEALLLRTTAARIFLDLSISDSHELTDFTNYDDTLFALNQLEELPRLPGTKFVFAHLIIPHSPFVFGENGEKIDIPYDTDVGNGYSEEAYKEGYRTAVRYINRRMLEILPQLIEDSKSPPIIVVAGDHGTPWGGVKNEVKILAALYLRGDQVQFNDFITPVNIFRVLFNEFFNGDFDLLRDMSYFVGENDYSFVSDSRLECLKTE